MSRFIFSWSGALALLLLFAHPAWADVTGLVRGHVTVDGIARGGVTVTITGNGATAQATTDPQGDFTFTRIPFGTYTVTAHVAGRPDASTRIEVTTDSINNVSLNIGELQEIGRANASAHSITGYPLSSNTITRDQISTLPQGNSLNSLVETVPGIVPFSYNEPVAHGFHGVTYEIDGAPLPQTTASNFSEIFDPRNIDSMEIFTGAFPAEFGGTRQGAVVNIISKRPTDIPAGVQTFVSAGGGTTYGNKLGSLNESIRTGATYVFRDSNGQRTALSPLDSLAVDLSNQYNSFQIPINTLLGPNTPVVNDPGQDDVQLEYNSFANVDYTHTSRDLNGYFQIIPSWRFSRIVYNGDLPNDVL